MPATTRSTTRKTRSLTVYTKPPPLKAVTQDRSLSSSRTTSRPSSKSVHTRMGHKSAPKVPNKRPRKIPETTVASHNVHEVERAEQMRIEWEAFVSERPPLKTLTAEDLPQSGKEVPHRIYGWPITEEYLLQYARRHRLTFLVSSNHRARFGGKEEFNYGDLTDEDLMDESLALSIRRFATLDVMIHFLGEVGARLTFERPVSRTLDWMLVLWSTDDYEEKYARYKMRGNWEKIEKFIDNALNECLPEGCERRTSLEWWWSLQNTLP